MLRSKKWRLSKRSVYISFVLLFFLLAGLFYQQEIRALPFSSSLPITQQTTLSDEPISQVLATAYFIDVGQGDATLFIFLDGKTLLVDSGVYAARDEVFSTLAATGVDYIDCLVGTHQDSDHIGSFDKIVEDYPIGTLYLPDVPVSLIPTAGSYGYLEAALLETDLTAVSPSTGDVILSGDDYQVKVLSDNTQSYADLNDYSIVLKVTVGDTSVLMMGDTEGVVEDQLLSSNFDLKCDILHVQHHGGSKGTSAAFLRAAAPSVAIISCGFDNPYNDPSPSVISRLKGIEILRTDQSGTIVIQTDGERISASVLSTQS